MRQTITAVLAGAAFALVGAAAFADEHGGDADKGEKVFKKCRACHMIKNGDETIERGGRTGPNLYGVIGRKAGSEEGYNYDEAMKKAGEAGLVWDEEKVAEYLHDPSAYLQKYLNDDSVRSKMTFKLKKGNEDVAAYLASVAK